MATWSSLRGSLTIRNQCTGDGVNLYFVSNDTDIYRYNPNTDTLTQISNAASWDAAFALSQQSGVNLCRFSSNLYAAGATADACQVYQYSGGGTSWTKVVDATGLTNPSAEVLMSNDSTIVFAYDDGLTGYGKHSTDGASWSDSTIGAFYFISSGFYFGNDTTLGIVASGRSGATYYTVSFSAGVWSIAETLGGVSEGHVTSQKDRFWKYATNYQWSTDFSSYTVPTDTTTRPGAEFNMPYPVGYRFGANISIYLWNQGADEWSASPETVASSGDYRHIIRNASGDVYILTATDIYGRDEPIPDPPGPTVYARFYFAPAGQALAEKFTLPFAQVAPGGLALDKSLGTVVIGAGEPSNQAVVYSAYPYPTGTASAVNFPTGTAITSIRWL